MQERTLQVGRLKLERLVICRFVLLTYVYVDNATQSPAKTCSVFYFYLGLVYNDKSKKLPVLLIIFVCPL